MIDLDDDAIIATADLVGRTGARELTIGHLHDNVPVEQAGWYAHAQYRGARITEENHRGPVEALDALARRLLTGAMCTHCRGLVALSDQGATVYPGASRTDGSRWTPDEVAAARARPQCRYRRHGQRWVRGCLDRYPERPQGPNRAERRRWGRK
jgi:hypothetical protein